MTSIRARAVLLVILTVAGIRDPLVAQVRLGLDAGVGGAPVDGRGTVSLWSVAPRLGLETGRLRIGAEGDYRGFGRLGWNAAGAVSASRFLPMGSPLLGELTSSLRGQAGTVLPDYIIGDAGARLHLRDERQGAWLGLQAGRDGRGGTLRWEAAVWRRFRDLSVQIAGSQLSAVDLVRGQVPVQDTLNPVDSSTTRNQVRVTTDLGLWLRWNPARLETTLGLGTRFGTREVAQLVSAPGDPLGERSGSGTRSSTRPWWVAEATYWLSPRLGVNGMVGARPPDTQTDAAGGRFLRLSLRARLSQGRATVGDERAAAGFRFRRSGELVRMELRAPNVSRVEIMGDFNDWVPLAMSRAGGDGWRAELPIRPGMHTVSVRYDGGPWQAPPGLRRLTTDFGGDSGVLVVE